MKFTFLFSILFFLTNSNGYTQNAELNLSIFDDLPKLQSQEQRPVFVFLTADWCRYCKNIEHTSFQQAQIIELLNHNFYTIIFNIEEQKEVHVFGQTFSYISSGLQTGVHELAEVLGTIDGVLNTPTFVLFDENLSIQYKYGGYLNSEDILALLQAASGLKS